MFARSHSRVLSMQRVVSGPKNETMTAIALMCAAALCFSLLDASAKMLSGVMGLPVAMVIWMRFVSHAILSVLLMGPHRIPTLMKSLKPGIQLFRSLFLVGATLFNFLAIKYLQLDQTVTIFFLGPLLVAALAGPLLGEWVGWRRLLAIMTGLVGVLMVMRPGFGGIHWAITFSFLSVVSYSFYVIATRYLAAYDPSEVTQFYSPIAGIVCVAPLALVGWQWPTDTTQWLLLFSLGIFGGFGHWLLILAHRMAAAPTLSPFIYTSLIWMTVLGYWLFGDVPDVWTLAGGAVVIASGLYLLYREQRTVRT